jgi:hypothetical protein
MKLPFRFLALTVVVLSVVALAATPASAQRRPQNGSGARPQPARPADAAQANRSGIIPRNRVTFTAEREAAALKFVEENRPELPAVLADLKARQPAEYQRAICDLFWTSEMLAAMRQDDPQRHELALRTWQLESLAHLQAARIAGAPENASLLQAELEQTVEQLVAAQLEESAYAVKRQEAQLKRSQERQKKLEARRAELVQERLSAIQQTIESTPSFNP